MCTVSWTVCPDGYTLFSNRDEQRARLEAAEPALFDRDGVRFLAPRDPQAGGTWIAVNESGFALCLLNSQGPRVVQPRSRGELVWRLAGHRSVRGVARALERIPLFVYPAFHLLALAPGEAPALWSWNGRQFRESAPAAGVPLISSSFDPESVRAARFREFYARFPTGPASDEALEAFHLSHAPAPSAYSPCMHRKDAETVSFSRIRVSAAEVEFFYRPGAPCRDLPGVTLRCPRRN